MNTLLTKMAWIAIMILAGFAVALALHQLQTVIPNL